MTTERSNTTLLCNCQLTKCQVCHKGLNSNYIRVGINESWKKVGLYCITCDIYYSPNLEKQYTVMQKQYTNLLKSHKSVGNRKNINMDIKPSNNPNKPAETIENLYGPGRMQVIFACNQQLNTISNFFILGSNPWGLSSQW